MLGRRHVNHRYLLTPLELPEGVVLYVYQVCVIEFELVMGFSASCTAPSLSSNTGMRGMPTPIYIKRQINRKNDTSLMTSASATYSASVAESVARFCVVTNQATQTPAHITTPPDADLLSSFQPHCSCSLHREPPARSSRLLCLAGKQSRSNSSASHTLKHQALSSNPQV